MRVQNPEIGLSLTHRYPANDLKLRGETAFTLLNARSKWEMF